MGRLDISIYSSGECVVRKGCRRLLYLFHLKLQLVDLALQLHGLLLVLYKLLLQVPDLGVPALYVLLAAPFLELIVPLALLSLLFSFLKL